MIDAWESLGITSEECNRIVDEVIFDRETESMKAEIGQVWKVWVNDKPETKSYAFMCITNEVDRKWIEEKKRKEYYTEERANEIDFLMSSEDREFFKKFGAKNVS